MRSYRTSRFSGFAVVFSRTRRDATLPRHETAMAIARVGTSVYRSHARKTRETRTLIFLSLPLFLSTRARGFPRTICSRQRGTSVFFFFFSVCFYRLEIRVIYALPSNLFDARNNDECTSSYERASRERENGSILRRRTFDLFRIVGK